MARDRTQEWADGATPTKQNCFRQATCETLLRTKCMGLGLQIPLRPLFWPWMPSEHPC
jgi:hypothetical protein